MRVDLLPLHGLDAAVEQAWAELGRSAAEPNPFYEPAAVIPAARHLAAGPAALLLAAFDGSAMTFALPVQRRRSYRHLPVPALVSWQHAYAFLGTPLVSPADPVSTWSAVLRFLRGADRAQWLTLERMPSDGAVAGALASAGPGPRSPVDVYDRPIVLRRPEPTYLDGRVSSRHLKSLRRLRRRLSETLGAEVQAVDRAGERAAVEGLLAMEATGWKGAAGTAMLGRPADAAFFRELCDRFASDGRLQLWSLEAAGRTAAYQCNLRAGTTVFHYKIAYDEELAAYSPGLQLELDMVTEFHGDDSLAQIDSCVDPGNRVSTQLYPDRRALSTQLVPIGGPLGAAATRTLPVLISQRDRLSRARARRSAS